MREPLWQKLFISKFRCASNRLPGGSLYCAGRATTAETDLSLRAICARKFARPWSFCLVLPQISGVTLHHIFNVGARRVEKLYSSRMMQSGRLHFRGSPAPMWLLMRFSVPAYADPRQGSSLKQSVKSIRFRETRGPRSLHLSLLWIFLQVCPLMASKQKGLCFAHIPRLRSPRPKLGSCFRPMHIAAGT